MTRPVDLRTRADQFDDPCDAGTLASLAAGFVYSSVLHTAVELGLFDHLGEVPLEVAALAGKMSCAPRGVERLLSALAALGLVDRLDDGRFRARQIAARMLCSASPMAAVLRHQRRHLYQLFWHLPEAVRQGEPQLDAWDFTDGGADVYRALARHPGDFRLFLEAMNASSMGTGEVIASQFDLSGVDRLIDLGGGGGQVAIELLRASPLLTVELVDLQPACHFAIEAATAAGVASRLSARSGDLLGELNGVAPAGAVLLSGVVGDFAAAERIRILRTARRLLRKGGSVLISETLFDPDRRGPLMPALLSLNMLLAARGDNFTAAEWEAMAREAGFTDVRVHRNGDRGVRDLIVAS